jgi:hypothetical protein
MAIIRIVRPPMVDAQSYDAVNAKLGIEQDLPEGLLMHSAGEVDGAWQIVDIWESEEHAQRFDDERLRPAIAEVSADAPAQPPPTTLYQLHSLLMA